VARLRVAWRERPDSTAGARHRLGPAASVDAIVASNYGEAGALEVLGHGLPPVVAAQG
jgi:hypothetical protein